MRAIRVTFALFLALSSCGDGSSTRTLQPLEAPDNPAQSAQTRKPVEMEAPPADPSTITVAKFAKEYARLGVPAKDGEPDLSQVTITLERTKCATWCPVYSVTLRGSGDSAYVGLSDVVTPGEKKFRASALSMRRLLERMNAIDFFAIECHSEASIVGAPHAYVTLQIGDRKKRIDDPFVSDAFVANLNQRDAVCFRNVTELANEIDLEAETEKWIGTLEDRRVRFEQKR